MVAGVPETQGSGMGSALLREGEAFARGRGFNRYTLNVAAANEGARRLYEGLGFQERDRVRSRVTKRLFWAREWISVVKRWVP